MLAEPKASQTPLTFRALLIRQSAEFNGAHSLDGFTHTHWERHTHTPAQILSAAAGPVILTVLLLTVKTRSLSAFCAFAVHE